MAPRLPVNSADRESEALALADMHRTGSLAWQELTYGHAPAFAHALNSGHDQVEKMGRPQCAHRPPNLQLAYAMLRGLEVGLPEARVLAPLRWLNETFRQLCYTAPTLAGGTACINLAVSHALKELGEYIALAATLVAEGRISGPELPQLKRELDEGIRAALEMQALLEQRVDELRRAESLATARRVQPGDRAREEAEAKKTNGALGAG